MEKRQQAKSKNELRTKTHKHILITEKGEGSAKKRKSGMSVLGESNRENTPREKQKLMRDRGGSFSRSLRDEKITTP